MNRVSRWIILPLTAVALGGCELYPPEPPAAFEYCDWWYNEYWDGDPGLELISSSPEACPVEPAYPTEAGALIRETSADYWSNNEKYEKVTLSPFHLYYPELWGGYGHGLLADPVTEYFGWDLVWGANGWTYKYDVDVSVSFDPYDERPWIDYAEFQLDCISYQDCPLIGQYAKAVLHIQWDSVFFDW